MREYLSVEAVNTRLRQIARFGNSFEGWLKWELVHALQQRLPDAVGVLEQIGVEWRYRRAQSTVTTEREAMNSKLIDLWVGQHSTAYFELKVVFANRNHGKQWRSWYADFTRLQALLTGEPAVAGFAAVQIAVGFSEDQWHRSCAELAQVEPTIQLQSELLASGELPIRFCSLAREFAPIG